MHLHVSMADESGANLFADATDGVNESLRHAIGGMLGTMADSMLVFAPHANSWRRIVARSYAPLTPTWGINNRSVAIRVPAGPRAARRFEHRVSGVDANPHLVAATVLAAVESGLAGRIDPGPAVTGNGYETAGAEPADMPRDWNSAIARAKASSFLRSALGAALHQSFIAIKEAESLRVAATVSELDYQLYLDSV